MVWLPASGKSTYAKELSQKEEAIIVSSDEIRKELLGDINDQTQNQLVFEEVEKRIIAGLKKVNVIYDATNLKKERRIAFLNKIKNIKAIKYAMVMATPLKECLERNENRERKVPENIITEMSNNFDVPQYGEGFNYIIFNT
jgi:predicted kinase